MTAPPLHVPDEIRAIDRPHRNLWWCYLVRAVFSGPLIVLTLPLLYFRYHTLRYRLDDEGLHMEWGLLFRREVNLTYARIQDIHLTSGPVQRWLGLADVHIQTAAGSATAEMKLEGLLQYLDVRDFLYSRMRGTRRSDGQHDEITAADGAGGGELANQLREVAAELRGAREALERLADRREVR
jgi:putative membrane protein